MTVLLLAAVVTRAPLVPRSGGEPAVAAEVRAVAAASWPPPTAPQAATTDADGRVAFRPAPIGPIQLNAGVRFDLDVPPIDGVVERVLAPTER